MVKFITLLLLAVFSSVQAGEVRVAVAANFLSTLKILAPAFEQQSGDRLIISSGSSGKLFAQIVNGAPYDVLLSADRSRPEKLEQTGKAVPDSRFVYATGRLVLWGREPLTQLTENTFNEKMAGKFAIANPRTAPYGLASQQVLQKLGVWKELRPGLIQGESIGQTFQFVATGNAELGFVALSQVLNPANPYNRVNYWSVPPGYYSSLEQEAVLLKHGKDNPAAGRFLNYLKGEAARAVMKQYGYL